MNSIEAAIRKTPPLSVVDRIQYPDTHQDFLNIEANNVPVVFINCPLMTKMTSHSDLLKSGFNPLVKARNGNREIKKIGKLLEVNLQDLLKSDFASGAVYVGKHRLSCKGLKTLLGVNIYDNDQILANRDNRSKYMWCGPPKCITPLHLDTINNLAWNVYGRKTWFLASPKDMYFNSYLEAFREPYIQNDKGLWIRSENRRRPSFSKVTKNPLAEHKDFPKAKEIIFHKVVLEKNEMLYLPAYWGHYVRTDTDSLMINHWYDQVPSILT